MVWVEVLEQAAPRPPVSRPPPPPHFKRTLDYKVLALKLEPLPADCCCEPCTKHAKHAHRLDFS